MEKPNDLSQLKQDIVEGIQSLHIDDKLKKLLTKIYSETNFIDTLSTYEETELQELKIKVDLVVSIMTSGNNEETKKKNLINVTFDGKIKELSIIVNSLKLPNYMRPTLSSLNKTLNKPLNKIVGGDPATAVVVVVILGVACILTNLDNSEIRLVFAEKRVTELTQMLTKLEAKNKINDADVTKATQDVNVLYDDWIAKLRAAYPYRSQFSNLDSMAHVNKLSEAEQLEKYLKRVEADDKVNTADNKLKKAEETLEEATISNAELDLIITNLTKLLDEANATFEKINEKMNASRLAKLKKYMLAFGYGSCQALELISKFPFVVASFFGGGGNKSYRKRRYKTRILRKKSRSSNRKRYTKKQKKH